jgi:hypothetical protein
MSRDGTQTDLRDRPVGDLIKELSEQTGTLVRQELALAKAEMSEKGRVAASGAGLFGAAGLLALLAAGALTACLIAALDLAMPTWLAAVLVALVYGVAAALLARTGRERVKAAAPPKPEQTVETIQEDVQWAKTRARSASR